MPVQEIPRTEWVDFCDLFKREHRGWLTTIEVLDEDTSPMMTARNIALQDIIVDLDNGNEDNIKIILGRSPEKGIAHSIVEPTYMRLEYTLEGALMGLRIAAASGFITILRFRTTRLSELLDDIVLN